MTYLVIYTGPMFAGKTTRLITDYLSSIANDKLVVKYDADTRYTHEAVVMSHTGQSIPCIMLSQLDALWNHIQPSSTELYIDEAQFFPKIREFIRDLDFRAPKIERVVLSGLDLDAKGKIFNPQFNQLIQEAQECNALYANCYECGAPAMYTKLLEPEQMTGETNILIGGSETYQPVCHDHFIRA